MLAEYCIGEQSKRESIASIRENDVAVSISLDKHESLGSPVLRGAETSNHLPLNPTRMRARK